MYPRAKTLGILLCNDRILVEEFLGKHSTGEGHYYRPIGGTIEFGEKSTDTLIREYSEELNVAIRIKKYIGCVENIFTIDGEIGHEIIQFYSVGFQEEANYKRELFEVVEGKKKSHASWISVDDLITGRKILYPTCLISELKRGVL